MVDGLAQTPACAPLRLEQRGRAGGLTPIVLLNALLNIVSLSFYRFWGRTKVRRYIWHNTYFMDEPLEYTGTGGELFKGFLVVFFLVIAPIFVVNGVAQFYFGPESMVFMVINAATGVGIFFLIGVAVYRARRYRLSRTVWRGIRSGMNGSSVQYAWRMMLHQFLNVITLGWSYPWMRYRLFIRVMNETALGDKTFCCKVSLAPLYRTFALIWTSMAIALCVIAGLSWQLAPEIFNKGSWQEVQFGFMPVALIVVLYLGAAIGAAFYRAREINHFSKGTSFLGLSFETRVTAAGLIGLMLLNILTLAITLGFGQPYTQLRVFRFICDRLLITGELDPAWIEQSVAQVPSMGEGLADAFDIGEV